MMRINSPLLLVAVSLFAVACGQGKINLVWGDTGDRYAPDATEGIIAKTPFEYPAWRGEKVNAQAFLSSDFPLDGVCLKVSDLKSGASRISSECVKTGFVEYVKADVIDSTVYGQCGFRDAGQFDSIMVADVIDISARKDIPDLPIHAKLGIARKGTQYLQGKRDYFGVAICFLYLLPAHEFQAYKESLAQLLEKAAGQNQQLEKDALLCSMGMPVHWEQMDLYAPH